MNELIGRVVATEKSPTTMDRFTFWTNADLKLHAFDIVKVQHIEETFTFGIIENISHITDAQSFLTSFISSDFGDVTVEEPTLRVGMNYVEATVSYNSGNLYTPVHNNAPVYLADAQEITQALGLDRIQNPLVCGSLKMYEGTKYEITLPVQLSYLILRLRHRRVYRQLAERAEKAGHHHRCRGGLQPFHLRHRKKAVPLYALHNQSAAARA